MGRYSLFRAVIAVVLIASAAGIWFVVRAIQNAVEAEKNLHAVIATANALEEFVASTGRWPTSWDELATLSKPQSRSMYQFPKDVDLVRQRVRVRFDLTLNELSKPQEMRLIEPIGPCFEFERRLEFLYKQIEDAQIRK